MPQLDLLLINAPSRIGVYQSLSEFTAIEPPVWAGLIARYCLNRGYSVEILDAEAEGLNIEDTAIEIMSRAPRLAVFCVYGSQPSASTQCLPAASAVVRIVNRAEDSVRIPTLALGTHISALPAKTLMEEPFDYVCQGEGPVTVSGLLDALQNDRSIKRGVPGLWQKHFIENVYTAHGTGSKSKNIEDLDRELPGQAWELLDMKRYRPHYHHLWTGDPKNGYASIQTSLNCVFSCHFCCIAAPFGDRKMRFWSPKVIGDQFETLVGLYGIRNVKVPDEMFLLNKRHVRGVCEELIKRGLGDQLNMWCYARVDSVHDPEMLDLVRRAGFKWLGIGIESANARVRNGIEKGKFRDESIITSIRRVEAAGIHVGANYIIGLPEDNRSSVKETYDLACELNTPMVNIYSAMAYPGSPLHETAKQKGWVLPEDPGGPGWLGYSQHSYETLPLPTEHLTSAEVLSLRDQFFMDYHQRSNYQAMIRNTFGEDAVKSIQKILSAGKPKRKLLYK